MPAPDQMPGLLGCCKKPIVAVNAACCSCCLIGRQCAAIDGQAKTLDVIKCIGSLWGPMYWICVCCIRRKISEKYSSFEENPCVSCFTAMLCPCCSLVQTQKFLRRNGVSPGLQCGMPSLDALPDDKKAQFQQERQKRRDERKKKNEERRGRRGHGHGHGNGNGNNGKGHGANKGTSSDSDSSD